MQAIRLESRGVLVLDGPEAAAFLQGLVTNDVTHATPQRAIHAALLTPQGKYLHDFFILGTPTGLLLDVEADRRDDLIRRLTLYRLRAKVTITDRTADFAVHGLLGEGAAAALGLGQVEGSAAALGEGWAFVDPRDATLGARTVLPAGEAESMLGARGFATAAFAVWDRARLEAGLPDGSRDLVVDKTLPLEAGFDRRHGVAFDKGCYVGQEQTARTRHRATIRRGLMVVRFDGPASEPDTVVTLGAREVGRIRSGQDGIALAMLRIEDVEAAASGDGPLLADGRPLRVTLPTRDEAA